MTNIAEYWVKGGVNKGLKGVTETSQLDIKCSACPCSPSFSYKLILISSPHTSQNMSWTVTAQWIPQYKPTGPFVMFDYHNKS